MGFAGLLQDDPAARRKSFSIEIGGRRHAGGGARPGDTAIGPPAGQGGITDRPGPWASLLLGQRAGHRP